MKCFNNMNNISWGTWLLRKPGGIMSGQCSVKNCYINTYTVHQIDILTSSMTGSIESPSYRPCGRLCRAGLLEGHVECVGPSVVCVGGDGRWGREGVKGGAGLGVGWRGGHVVLCVVIVVGTGGGGATILDVLVHAVQEPQVCILWLERKWKGWGRGKGDRRQGGGVSTKECLYALQENVTVLQSNGEDPI